MGAVRNTADVRSGDTAVVIALGGVGLSAVAGLKLAGAGRIIAVDISEDKATAAFAIGATDFVAFSPKLAKDVRRFTNGRGVDHAFECVGKSDTIRAAWTATRRGGQCVVVGVGRTSDTVTFNAMEIYHFARTLTSSIFGSADPERDIPEIAGHILSGRVDLGGLVTHRCELDGVGEAFDRMRRGDGVRTLVRY